MLTQLQKFKLSAARWDELIDHMCNNFNLNIRNIIEQLFMANINDETQDGSALLSQLNTLLNEVL